MSNNQFQLFNEIVKLSVSNKWDIAKTEWCIEGVTIDETCNSSCLCGKKNIKELNHMRNKINNNYTIVGSCCVEKFMGIQSKFLIKVIEHLKKFQVTILSGDYIVELYKQNFINDCDGNFYLDITNRFGACSKTQKITSTKLEKITQKEVLRLSYINMKILNSIEHFIDNDILIVLMQTYQENIKDGVTENCYMVYDIVKRFNIMYHQKENLLYEHGKGDINEIDYKNNNIIGLILNGCSDKYDIDRFFNSGNYFYFQINIDYIWVELKDNFYDKNTIMQFSTYIFDYIYKRLLQIESEKNFSLDI